LIEYLNELDYSKVENLKTDDYIGDNDIKEYCDGFYD